MRCLKEGETAWVKLCKKHSSISQQGRWSLNGRKLRQITVGSENHFHSFQNYLQKQERKSAFAFRLQG